MKGKTELFLNHLFELGDRELPPGVVRKAKNCILDYVCVTLAGAKEDRENTEVYCQRNREIGKALVLGTHYWVDSLTAAFLNGMNAHRMELDDGHRRGMIHLGAAVVSAVFSAAQCYGLSGKDVIKGIVLGYEAATRLAVSVQPTHKKRGYHTAGTCGTVGAAIGVAAALGLEKHRWEAVTAAAMTSAAGILEIQEDSSNLKPYNLGRAAMDGLAAARVGFTDWKGPEDILGGSQGFGMVLAEECSGEKLTEETNYYEIERIYVKPYAACRHCHSAIEAALKLREKVYAEEIRGISVETYHLAVKGHDHRKILGAGSAKLSIPYSVAVALLTGSCGPEAFEEPILSRADILNMTDLVRVVEKKEFTICCPEKRMARVTVHTVEGEQLSATVGYAKGEPENPLTQEEMEEKARLLLRKAGREDDLQDILACIEDYETQGQKLFGLLAGGN